MALFSETTLYPRVPTHDRRDSSDYAFVLWASIVLAGLAIVSIALGVAPIVDPAIFVDP